MNISLVFKTKAEHIISTMEKERASGAKANEIGKYTLGQLLFIRDVAKEFVEANGVKEKREVVFCGIMLNRIERIFGKEEHE